MIPAAFDYEVAESADHAISLLGEHGEDAKLLAGGHSLLPLMRLRLAAPVPPPSGTRSGGAWPCADWTTRQIFSAEAGLSMNSTPT